jgi:hypothetical protein
MHSSGALGRREFELRFDEGDVDTEADGGFDLAAGFGVAETMEDAGEGGVVFRVLHKLRLSLWHEWHTEGIEGLQEREEKFGAALAGPVAGYGATAVGMLAFGYLAGLAVLNGWIQGRSGLSTSVFGLVLATGALAALGVNVYLRRAGKRYSGEFGLLLLSFAVWLPVLAQSLPALLLAYSLQGAASRIALAGLYRAIAEVQRRGVLAGGARNTTLTLESMAGFGLALSFLLNS